MFESVIIILAFREQMGRLGTDGFGDGGVDGSVYCF